MIKTTTIYWDANSTCWYARTQKECGSTVSVKAVHTPTQVFDALTSASPDDIYLKFAWEGTELPWWESDGIKMLSLGGYLDLHAAELIAAGISEWNKSLCAVGVTESVY